MDKYSRVTWLYLMRFKSETLACLKSFIAMVQTQFNAKILHIRINNGQEFLAHSTQFFFSNMTFYMNVLVWRHLNKTV